LLHVALATIVTLTSWLVAAVVVLIVAKSLDAAGHAMSWFTRVSLVIGLFAAPAFGASLAWFSVVGRLCAGDDFIHSRRRLQGAYFDSALVICSLVLAVLTWMGSGAAHILVLLIFFPLVAHAFTEKSASNTVRLSSLYASVVLPNLMVLHTVCGCLLMFVPIMGRAGGKLIPDLFISVLVAVGVVVVLMYHTGFVFVSRPGALKRVIFTAMLIFVVTFLLVLFTPLG